MWNSFEPEPKIWCEISFLVSVISFAFGNKFQSFDKFCENHNRKQILSLNLFLVQIKTKNQVDWFEHFESSVLKIKSGIFFHQINQMLSNWIRNFCICVLNYISLIGNKPHEKYSSDVLNVRVGYVHDDLPEKCNALSARLQFAKRRARSANKYFQVFWMCPKKFNTLLLLLLFWNVKPPTSNWIIVSP